MTYTFLNEKGDVVKIINNNCEYMGGTGLPPELLKKQGADILICKDLGPRALNLCQELKIEVHICQENTVQNCFNLWQAKKLKKAGLENICEDHKKI